MTSKEGRMQRMFFAILLLLPSLCFSMENKSQTIAVLDFKGDGIEQGIANNFSNKLRRILSNDNRFKTVERDNMYDILKEQGYQQSGCISSECVVDMGKLIGAKIIVAGSVGKIGQLYTMTARLISIETGKIEKEAEITSSKPIEILYLAFVNQIYAQLFPSIGSSIFNPCQDSIYLALKNKANLKTLTQEERAEYIKLYKPCSDYVKKGGSYDLSPAEAAKHSARDQPEKPSETDSIIDSFPVRCRFPIGTQIDGWFYKGGDYYIKDNWTHDTVLTNMQLKENPWELFKK